jgi:molecular chaperone GrpE (heat shock protein)
MNTAQERDMWKKTAEVECSAKMNLMTTVASLEEERDALKAENDENYYKYVSEIQEAKAENRRQMKTTEKLTEIIEEYKDITTRQRNEIVSMQAQNAYLLEIAQTFVDYADNIIRWRNKGNIQPLWYDTVIGYAVKVEQELDKLKGGEK